MPDNDFTVPLLENPKVEGTAFPRSGSEGLSKSIAAVPDGWVRPASTHISIARILTPGNEDLWRWFDVNGEGARVRTEKSYDGIEPGTHYLLIVNGQTFSRDPDAMLKYVQSKGELDGKQNVGLISNSVPLSAAYADRVLGERVVWAVKDGKIQEIAVPVFTPDQYREAQQDINFLQQYPTFIGVFTEEQAQEYRHNDGLNLRNDHGVFSPDPKLAGHVPSHMQAGTKDVWDRLLKVTADDRGYDTFYAGMPELAENSGRVVFADCDNLGFYFNDIGDDGCSVGVKAPEALDALVSQFIALREP